jgi:hypothetical protein
MHGLNNIKNSNIKFHENSFSRSLLFYMRTEGRTERGIDMTKLIVPIRKFANALKKLFIILVLVVFIVVLKIPLNIGYCA